MIFHTYIFLKENKWSEFDLKQCMWWTDIEAAIQGAICICRRYCRYLGFSPVPIWQMIESIHMIWSRTMPKNLSLSVSVVICTRHSSQDVSSSFQHCITSCSRHAMASAFSPAYTVLSWAALSCSWRTWQSVKASFSKQLNWTGKKQNFKKRKERVCFPSDARNTAAKTAVFRQGQVVQALSPE